MSYLVTLNRADGVSRTIRVVAESERLASRDAERVARGWTTVHRWYIVAVTPEWDA
jgi:hypothetical protein